jgi:hypothetical protein
MASAQEIIMRRIIASAGLAAALAIGPLAAIAPASAQELHLQIGPDGVRPIIRDHERERGRGDCSPREARRAARQEGLRNIEVVRVTERSVTIEGDNPDGYVETLRFANRRGCPII